ncbi:hypothetical protein JCM16106_07690 [Hydrogenophilus islandicus]
MTERQAAFLLMGATGRTKKKRRRDYGGAQSTPKEEVEETPMHSGKPVPLRLGITILNFGPESKLFLCIAQ